jgi:FkbM family methyltransferase
MYVSSFNQVAVGSAAWLLKEAKGARIFDKSILIFLKVIYLGSRVFLRIILGKKKRNRIYAEREINFKDFLYRSIESLGLDKYVLLEFNVPKYDYKFYSLITRKIENFLIEDMYNSMSAHEDDIIEHFSPKQGDIVVDIGAAFGFYTIISSKRVDINGKVLAIEAHPSNFEMLNRNIKLNQLTNVIPLNYAVFSKETKIKLYLPAGDIFTKYNTIMSNWVWVKPEDKFVEVNANTLDNLLQQIIIKQVNWIKIDVEGAEFEVLKEAHNLLLNSNPVLNTCLYIQQKDKTSVKKSMTIMGDDNSDALFDRKIDIITAGFFQIIQGTNKEKTYEYRASY